MSVLLFRVIRYFACFYIYPYAQHQFPAVLSAVGDRATLLSSLLRRWPRNRTAWGSRGQCALVMRSADCDLDVNSKHHHRVDTSRLCKCHAKAHTKKRSITALEGRILPGAREGRLRGVS